jgi:ABC-2 type transport system ATP-binding protein
MLWFCGGHGVCLTDAGDTTRVARAAVAWLDRYVKRDTSIALGPKFDTVDQNGTRYTAADYPVPSAGSVAADGSGTLSLVDTGGAGPAQVPAGTTNPLAGIAAAITPGKATNAVDVAVGWTRSAVVVGAPKLTLTYHGTAGSGSQPTRVFAQLVDESTGLVLGNQITPIKVTLDGKSHSASTTLEDVMFSGDSSSKVTLQLVATTTAYSKPRLGGQVEFDKIHVELPVGKIAAAS